MRVLILLVLFIVVPLAELYVLYRVGDLIGILPTIGLLLLDSILGTVLWRTQGRAAWRRFTEALQSGRPPAKEVVDGVFIIAGGLLLLTPGFLTDLLGVLLLLPPTRSLVRREVMRRLGKRIVASMTGAPVGRAAGRPGRAFGPFGMAPGARAARPRQDFDVEGRAVDVDVDVDADPGLPR